MNKKEVSILKQYQLQDRIPNLKDELQKLRKWFDKNEVKIVAELLSVLWPIHEHTEILISNDDFHLKSAAGRWDPASQTCVQDGVTSPCIDAGDLLSPIGWELFPNGGFVNMGVHGGTLDASMTYFGGPPCETIVAGDINGDGQVNRADLEIMALHWTDEEPLSLP